MRSLSLLHSSHGAPFSVRAVSLIAAAIVVVAAILPVLAVGAAIVA